MEGPVDEPSGSVGTAQPSQAEASFNAFLAGLSGGGSSDPRVNARVAEMLQALRRMSVNSTDGEAEARSARPEEPLPLPEDDDPEVPAFLEALGFGLRGGSQVEEAEARQEARMDNVVIPAIPPLLAASSLLQDQPDLGLEPINRDILDLIRAVSDPGPQRPAGPAPRGAANSSTVRPTAQSLPARPPARLGGGGTQMIADQRAQPQMMGGAPTFDNISGLMGLDGIESMIGRIPGLMYP